MTKNRVKMQKQNRSITFAMNFHSLHTSFCLSSSFTFDSISYSECYFNLSNTITVNEIQWIIIGGIDESNSAHCDRCYYSVIWPPVRLSHSCTLLKPLDGTRCHLAGTLQVTSYWTGPQRGEIWGRNPGQDLHFKLRQNRCTERRLWISIGCVIITQPIETQQHPIQRHHRRPTHLPLPTNNMLANMFAEWLWPLFSLARAVFRGPQ